MKPSILHSLRLALLVGALSLPVAAWAETASPDLAAAIGRHYAETKTTVDTLKASQAPADKLILARLLLIGLPRSATNPIPRPDLVGANALIEELIAGPDLALRQQAQALKSQVLLQSTLPADVEAGKALELQLATDGYAAALARIVLRDGAIPESISQPAAIATLERGVLSANYSAAFALAQILAPTDPTRSKALASQALVFLTVSAATNPGAATELARRLIDGQGMPADPARALTVLSDAAAKGSNSAISTLNDAIAAKAKGIDLAAARTIILAGVAAGSSKAIDLVITDLTDHPVYGFSQADALFAVSLAAEAGDRNAMATAARVYIAGLGAAPDLDKALPYVEQLANPHGLDSAAMLKAGDQLESLGLPIALAIKYIVPLYREVSGAEADEAEYRADHLMALGTAAGVVSPQDLGPDKVAAMIDALRAAGGRKHAGSLLLLGDLYYGGIWVPLNTRQALTYYRQSLAIESTIGGRERLAKALLATKSTPFEEQQFRELVAELVREGSKWALAQKAILGIEDGTAVAAGEVALLDLSKQSYAPATRALLRRLAPTPSDARVAAALKSYEDAWKLRKDPTTGKLLGEFYGIAGRGGDAIAILADPILADDPDALLALTHLQAAAPSADVAALVAQAQRGIALSAGNPTRQFEFADAMMAFGPDAGQAAMEQLADAGNVEAIGSLFDRAAARGTIDDAELAKFVPWARQLAQAGNDLPLVALAGSYLTATSTQETAAGIFGVLHPVTALLPPESDLPLYVAQAYYGGYGTKKDLAQGNALVEAGAAAGNRDALAELGIQFFYGMGRPRDTDTALALLESGSALGSNIARVELGRLYSSASGPSVDAGKAHALFLAAANTGSLPGMVELGRLYLAGWGVPTDADKGVSWLTKAANQGSSDAMFQLYFHYLLKGDPTDRATAMTWLHRSVDADVNSARVRLAATLLTEDGGNTADPTYGQAMSLLDDAYDNGYNLAAKYKRRIVAPPVASLPETEDLRQ